MIPSFNWPEASQSNFTIAMSELSFAASKKPYLKGKTLFITGSSRGIGRAIALRAALDGANVSIVAKTTQENPKLPGTIYSVAEEVVRLGGKALPIICDIRDEKQIEEAIKNTVERFGGIDILVNNASAISLTRTLDINMKRFDLMHQINVRGTFAVSKAALPHLQKSNNPHILNLSPPLDMKPEWFGPHVAYSMSKYGMSMVVLGLAEEFKEQGVAVNALWPKTIISTSALQAFAGDQLNELYQYSRSAAIMADAAYAIFCQPSRKFSGRFFIDEEVLYAQSIWDLSNYACDPRNAESLAPDLFVDVKKVSRITEMIPVLEPRKTIISKI